MTPIFPEGIDPTQIPRKQSFTVIRERKGIYISPHPERITSVTPSALIDGSTTISLNGY